MNKSIHTHCGYAAIIGRPNVGKSTLLNRLIGKKISIISHKPQTTRHQILGIKTYADVQVIYIDTPGMHTQEQSAINRYMNQQANAWVFDADVILWVIEVLQWTKEDDQVLTILQEARAPVFLVINKIDQLEMKSILLPFIETVRHRFSFTQIIPVSAESSENLSSLEKCVQEVLPVGPFLYPPEAISDKDVLFQVAEIIREKIFQTVEQEVPYRTTVTVENYQKGDKQTEISAVIWVEREGQKMIIVGRKGEKLKTIGIRARKDIQNLIGQHVYLHLWVKVKEHWTEDEDLLKQLGY